MVDGSVKRNMLDCNRDGMHYAMRALLELRRVSANIDRFAFMFSLQLVGALILFVAPPFRKHAWSNARPMWAVKRQGSSAVRCFRAVQPQ